MDQQKVKVDLIPSDAVLLYIQLYCERKGDNDENSVQEARKSWSSLSTSRKKYFYKTISDKNSVNFAHDLSKTKTYLKEKVSKHRKNIHSLNYNSENEGEDRQHVTETSINESHSSELESQPLEGNVLFNDQVSLPIECSQLIDENNLNHTKSEVLNENKEDTRVRSPSIETGSSVQLHEPEDRHETHSNASNQSRATVPIVEPTPPTVKVGKDLYEVIKGPGKPNWMELTPKERSHYNSAVRTIKREYIVNYMNYLENLPQQKLFDHYMKTLH